MQTTRLRQDHLSVIQTIQPLKHRATSEYIIAKAITSNINSTFDAVYFDVAELVFEGFNCLNDVKVVLAWLSCLHDAVQIFCCRLQRIVPG